MAKVKILIVDDEKPTRDAMARLLSSDYACLTAPDGDRALEILRAETNVALVITDYKMPGMNGVELIRAIKRLSPAPACLLLTAFGEISLAVEATKAGASDFITKPVTDLDQLEFKVAQAIETDAPAAAKAPAAAEGASEAPAPFTGSSDAMTRIYRLIRKVAPTNATVLVEGPSGSGKELVARAVHSLSARAKGPFIAIECSAFPGELLASELFGYMPGTFTGGLKEGKAGCFEAADGGTIFLDEIGEIDRATQVALLRVLESKSVRRLGSAEEHTVDFRLVAATNRDLASMVAAGTFREDLFYRLNVIDIRMPALCERPGDIPLLARRFLKDFSAANGGLVTDITPEALAALEAYNWPGNVRQLRNVIEKMVVLASTPTLTKDDLPPEVAVAPKPPPTDDGAAPARLPTGSSLAETEKTAILAALEDTHGNKSKAAERLGISRRTLHRKLNEWNQK